MKSTIPLTELYLGLTKKGYSLRIDTDTNESVKSVVASLDSMMYNYNITKRPIARSVHVYQTTEDDMEIVER